MSEYGDIQRLLGSIETGQENNTQQLQTIFSKIDVMSDKHTELLGVVKELNNRVELLESEIAEDIVPTVQEVKLLKQRGIGVLIVIGLLSAGAGSMITKALKYFNIS
jgi:Sec7-like guanine-nucleotide exchange factor